MIAQPRLCGGAPGSTALYRLLPHPYHCNQWRPPATPVGHYTSTAHASRCAGVLPLWLCAPNECAPYCALPARRPFSLQPADQARLVPWLSQSRLRGSPSNSGPLCAFALRQPPPPPVARPGCLSLDGLMSRMRGGSAKRARSRASLVVLAAAVVACWLFKPWSQRFGDLRFPLLPSSADAFWAAADGQVTGSGNWWLA